MKCPSMYNFYRTYFDIPGSGKLHFALAIRDADKQLAEIFKIKDPLGYERYCDQPYARQLAKTFLRNFYMLAQHHYSSYFHALEYQSNTVTFSKEILGTRVSLEIPFSFFYEAKEKKIIFMEYGKLDSVHLWQAVFKTLTSNYSLSTRLPIFEKVIYWDLLKGNTRELIYDEVEFAPRDRVLTAARRYISFKNKL